MRRNSPRTGPEWLARFARIFAQLHVEVDLGSTDAIAMLRFQGGEAVTIADEEGATILFGSRAPSASAVLEEVAHVLQHRRGRFVGEDLLVMRCLREIEAKECLLTKGATLGIPPDEQKATRRQLLEERTILESLRWR
jgi:hypothetical protein